MPDSCTKVWDLGVGQYNGIIQTGPQPTPVAVVTKFSHVAARIWHACKTAEGDHQLSFATLSSSMVRNYSEVDLYFDAHKGSTCMPPSTAITHSNV